MAEPLDVAIVGGGVAGLYCAFSLVERGAPVPGGDGPPRVALLECSERLGGRIRTQAPPDAPHLRAEVGGMRFYDSQTLLAGLVGRLGLTSVPFHRAVMNDEHDLFYLRGTRFTLADLLAGSDAVPYALADDERGVPVSALVRRAIERAIPDYLSISSTERRARESVPTPEGPALYERSLESLLSAALTDEAVALVRDGGGYREQLDPEVSAALVLQVGDSVGGQRTIQGGMQGLTDALVTAVEDRVDLRTETTVRGVEEGPDGLLSLRCERGGASEVVEARHVVLALPRHALDALDRASGPLAAPVLGEAIDGTVPVEAVKVYLGFAEPWWEPLGIASGKSVTDLPMHQCLYFGVEGEAPGARPEDRHALLVATYADAEDVRYWRALARRGDAFEGGFTPPKGLEASDVLVGDVRRQLGEVHGIEVPTPEWAIFVDWGVEPFGAGWHYWRTGTLSERMIPAVRRPSSVHPLYVCGEAFSGRQGWIQGALQTTEHVLRDHLGQPGPRWLAPDADLGP